MIKLPSIFTTSLSALVMVCAMAAFFAQPTVAQSAKKLNCNGCVKSKQLKNNGIRSGDIKDGQVKNADLSNNAVTGGKVQDGSLTAVDLGDEAGVDFVGGPQFLTLPAGTSVVRSIVVTVPRAGFVIVNASGEFRLGANAEVRCSLETGTVLDNFDRLEAGGLPDPHSQGFGMTEGFAVLAGTTTFNLICVRDAGSVSILDSDLTAIYAPTQY